jgi:hypothetical protein
MYAIISFVCRDEDYRSEPDGTNVSVAGYKPNIEELEMLLEAYFVQIDGTLNKLSHVRVVPFPMLLASFKKLPSSCPLMSCFRNYLLSR